MTLLSLNIGKRNAPRCLAVFAVVPYAKRVSCERRNEESDNIPHYSIRGIGNRSVAHAEGLVPEVGATCARIRVGVREFKDAFRIPANYAPVPRTTHLCMRARIASREKEREEKKSVDNPRRRIIEDKELEFAMRRDGREVDSFTIPAPAIAFPHLARVNLRLRESTCVFQKNVRRMQKNKTHRAKN